MRRDACSFSERVNDGAGIDHTPSPLSCLSRWPRSRSSTTADPLTQATPDAPAGGAVTGWCRSPGHCARHLPGGGVEAVEEVGRGNHEDQGREPLLCVVPAGLVPDLVGDRVRPIGETGGSLGEREGGTFGVGEVGCLPPGRHCEEALVCFACLPGATCARVNAEAAAIDLARAQVDKLKRRRRHAALSRGLEQGLYGIHCVRKDHCRVAHSCLHNGSPSGIFAEKNHQLHLKMSNRMLNIQVSIETLLPTCVPRELVSLSHRWGFARHYYDGTKRRNVTDERTRMAGTAIRGLPEPPAGGGLPDARRPYRGGRRRTGVLAP